MFHSGSLLVTPTNIRLGWKSVQVANTLAYYDTAIITAIKSFIVQAPGLNYILFVKLTLKSLILLAQLYVNHEESFKQRAPFLMFA